MINAPRFAFSEGPQTFSLRLDLDPRVVNWHVDHYTRNMKNGSYTLCGYWGGGLLRGDHYVVSNLFNGGKLAQMICPNFWGANIHIPALLDPRLANETVFFDYMYYTGQKLTCPNFSLTRYDKLIKPGYSKMNGIYFYTHELPTVERIAPMFGVCFHDLVDLQNHYLFMTRSKCGRLFHGPAYDIRKSTASTWL